MRFLSRCPLSEHRELSNIAILVRPHTLSIYSGVLDVDVVHLTNQDSSMSRSTSVSQSRAPTDHIRWSQSYASSIPSLLSLVRSDSSSGYETSIYSLPQKARDLGWQPVDERDEVELISDADTEDTDLEAEYFPEVEREEERTSAVVIAEEGRGLIVRGDGMAVADLVVQSGAVVCPSLPPFSPLTPLCSPSHINIHLRAQARHTCSLGPLIPLALCHHF